jgi:hypothetical protein
MGSALLAAVNVASSSPPAGGAATDQIVIATAGAIVLTAALLILGIGHRSGRFGLLGRLAGYSERVSGLPGWVALPAAVATASLLTAFLGMMWDISIHIDQGRDQGPLANPAHYLILAGLFGIFSAGYFACVLPERKPSASAIRIVGDWYAPLGGVLMMACGMFSLTGFPLDDMWHRLFGQDVTLWGPTHLMLIGGAAMTLLGIAVLMVEGTRANAREGRDAVSWVLWTRRSALSGALLLGLSTFQAEFDFGVPQFRFIFGPLLVMIAAGVGLTATRMWLGRGSALAAVAFFLLVRGAMSVAVGPILGETTPHFPLFVVSAIVVEVIALRASRERAVRFGLACGLGIGTVGLASEWAWSNIWMPIHWSADLFPEGAIVGLAGALAASVVGAWVGQRLASDELPRTRSIRTAGSLAAIALIALVGYALNKPSIEDTTASVQLTQVHPGPQRTVDATVKIDPPSAAADSEFLNATSWQGGGLVVDQLQATGEPGTYRTTEPLPVYGDWKTTIRMSNGNTLSSIPVYLPADPAIPVGGVPAKQSFTRTFVADHKLLQREQKDDVPGWLTSLAYLVVAGIAFSLLALLAWGLHRLSLSGTAGAEERREAESRAPLAPPKGAGA